MGKFRVVRARATAVAACLFVGGTLAVVPATTATSAAAAPAAPASVVDKVPTFTLPLKVVGKINLGSVAKADQRRAATQAAPSSTPKAHRSVDSTLVAHSPKAAASTVTAPTTPLSTTNVRGEQGFSALGGVQQADTVGGSDLEPPDQGLCAGNGYVMEFINNALAVFDAHGDQVVSPIGSAQAFKQPTSDFFSDPRCYYDSSTQRWFYQEFITATFSKSGKVVIPSTEFEAVSDTPDPTGSFTIYSFNTTDPATPGCPCFGDYDQLGADANGIYISTDQFGVTSPAYNGSVIYAISKGELETAATTGIAPTVFGYRLAKDPFGQPYIVAPASSPPGTKFAPGTEYFVESNGNARSDHHLVVYALSNTADLAAPAAPTLYRTEISTEAYSVPANATQKPGPRPLGAQYQEPAGTIEADFDAAMEPVYADGELFAQLDTGTASGYDGVDWWVLRPTLAGSTLTATVAHQGIVAVKDASTLYPYTAVDSSGVGYLLFALSGPNTYPSPAYVPYNIDGPTGPVILATSGAAPEDGFTCYAAFVGPNYGGCRWGDYSMGAVMGGRVYMATEMVPQGYRDLLTNWGTYIWSAPPPVPAG